MRIDGTKRLTGWKMKLIMVEVERWIENAQLQATAVPQASQSPWTGDSVIIAASATVQYGSQPQGSAEHLKWDQCDEGTKFFKLSNFS